MEAGSRSHTSNGPLHLLSCVIFAAILPVQSQPVGIQQLGCDIQLPWWLAMQRRDRKNRRSYAVLNFDLSEREPCGTASWTGLVFWFWPVIAVRGSIIQAASLSGFFSSSLSVGISLFCPASGRTVIVAGQQRRASTILCVLDHLLQGFGVTDQPPILACKLFQAILALILVQQTQLHVLVVCWVFPPQRAVPVSHSKHQASMQS
eukprot:359094-Chlamydomonas_euryale.AAC.16